MIPTAEHRPSAPPTSPRNPDEVALLLTFLRERDHACPRCGYNLRNLTQPVCPECREDLVLRVGIHKVVLHWLLLTLAPSVFCCIACGIFVVMMALHGRRAPGGIPLEVILVMAFLAVSSIAGVGLAMNMRAFLRQRAASQLGWAALTWAAHLTTFAFVAAWS